MGKGCRQKMALLFNVLLCKNKKAREIFGSPSGVDKPSSSDALGSRFKPLTISTNTVVIPFTATRLPLKLLAL